MTYSILPDCVKAEAVRPFIVDIPDEELACMKTLLSLSNIPGVCYENSLPGGNRSLGLPREWLLAAKLAWENEFNWYGLSTSLTTRANDLTTGKTMNVRSMRSLISRSPVPIWVSPRSTTTRTSISWPCSQQTHQRPPFCYFTVGQGHS
jgi:hypothetical protein